ncbi:hypothetical protein [Lentiprolixibacter aurantiacus]|uniref:Uncharacterized protein n=1 Tax=Lentiprolixibacter aurantiacus TaxID=2993939 RepID=A0AAE3SNX4_9FLAO|nr:hypothetical protein [Lentiprolixibacter aurantiacus]MCX2718922.1 hypothetical protein [Lentiprolixibacter aurantiacus]
MESVLELKYCERCETYTKWFMGKGKFPDLPSDLYENPYKNLTLPELKSILDEKKERGKLLQVKMDSLSKNILTRLLFFRKLNSLKRNQEYLLESIREIKQNIDESKRNLDFYEKFDIDFYEKLGVKPKCMKCGYDKLNDKPKHSCGGDLVIVPSKDIIVDPIFKVLYTCEYDEYGKVVSRKRSL